MHRAFSSQSLRRLRQLVKSQPTRWSQAVQETKGERVISQEEGRVAFREHQWGECTIRLGAETYKRDQMGLDAYTISDRSNEVKIRPQNNMTDLDYV